MLPKSTTTRKSFAVSLPATLIIATLLVQTSNGFRTTSLRDSGTGRKLFGGYRITPKTCRATKTLPQTDPRVDGPTICMFNHECAQRNGEVVGACMDGFLFGACCQIPKSDEIESTLINDAQNAYFQQHHQQQKLQPQEAMSNPAAAQSYETYGGESLQHQHQHEQQHQQQSTENQYISSSEGNKYEDQLLPQHQQQEQSANEQANIDKVFQQLESSSSSHGQQTVQSTSPQGSSSSYATTSSYSNEQYEKHKLQQKLQEQEELKAQQELKKKQQLELKKQQEHHKQQELIKQQELKKQHELKKQQELQQQQQLDHKRLQEMKKQQLLQQQHDVSTASPDDSSQSSIGLDFEVDSSLQSNIGISNSNSIQDNSPANVQVSKDTVKISSASSPPHSSISQSTPVLQSDIYTTDLPSKINNSLVDRSSSESNSFEETPASHLHDQVAEAQQLTQAVHTLPPQLTNSHQHDHLMLDIGSEFTHSDITHPGADSELLEEDLQFSTGYGPQPVYVELPSKQQTQGTIIRTPSPEDKYVLVQTITNAEPNRKPSTMDSPSSTSPSVTIHVDSIESIISQLNNSNNRPFYSTVNSLADSSDNSEPIWNSTSNTIKPLVATPTISSGTSMYEEVETKRPQDRYPAEIQGQQQPQIPAYLATLSTNVDSEVPISHATMSTENAAVEPPTPTSSEQSYESGSEVLEDHTLPESTYNDVIAADHPTSEFNKMPAIGIAYPVDISFFESAEGNILHDSGEQQSSSIQPSSTASISQKPVKLPTESEPTYTRLPTIPEKRPGAANIGVITAQNYNQLPLQSGVYNQVPDEVSVSSHTTQVQSEEYTFPSSPAYEAPTPIKLTTFNLVDNSSSHPTVTPAATRPLNNATTKTSTTIRPALVTASRIPKPKPTTISKRPTNRPGTSANVSGNRRTTKPPNKTSYPQLNPEQPILQPVFTVNQPAQPIIHHEESQSNFNSYDSLQPVFTVNQPATLANHVEELQTTTTFHSTLQPVFTVNQPATPVNIHDDPQTTINSHNVEPIYTKKPAALTNQNNDPSTRVPSTRPGSNYISTQQSYTKQSEPNTRNPVHQTTISHQLDEQTFEPVLFTPSKRPINTRKPGTTKTPTPQNNQVSTSYITGPTSPRPQVLSDHLEEEQVQINANNKLDFFAHSTAQASLEQNSSDQPTHAAPLYLTSVSPISVQHPQNHYNTYPKPGFVKIQPTANPPVPTVHITPKPTVINVVTSSTWTRKPSADSVSPQTTPSLTLGSTSYIYSPLVTRRPDNGANSPEYVSIQPVSSNDFDDPGYYGAQDIGPVFNLPTTEAVFPIPADDRPAFPGYYGPTPTYPVFQVPNEKVGAPVEFETYTSPNDFVNFPPVRNPNLNMSATSSAVTSDLDISTPAFVEDVILKDKMNTLVHKLAESLQGNFDALSDMIDNPNDSAHVNTYQATAGATGATGTRKPTRKPSSSTTRPRPTTKKPITRVSTKVPSKKPPTVTTRKPVTRRTTTTRKPATRKPTRKATTTTQTPEEEEEIADEEDGEDVSPSENEIEPEETSGGGGRKFQCGVRPHVKSGRIVGGKGSTFGAFPWQVLVRESTWLGLFTKNKCGGVLITNRYIITAAHCQPGFLASLVAVMGEYDISGDLESKRSVTKNVKRVIVHRQYDPATFENDLALLELDSPVQFDSHIVPICMPVDTADFTGRMATVTGWGRLKYGGGVPSVLQEVQVPVIENSVCQEMFHTAGHNKKILSSFLCAGYANGQKDSCEGDSGGPLVLQRPDGRYELAGTVSHGIKCAAPYLPGVYMRTTYYKPWLRSITGVK